MCILTYGSGQVFTKHTISPHITILWLRYGPLCSWLCIAFTDYWSLLYCHKLVCQNCITKTSQISASIVMTDESMQKQLKMCERKHNRWGSIFTYNDSPTDLVKQITGEIWWTFPCRELDILCIRFDAVPHLGQYLTQSSKLLLGCCCFWI